MSNEEKKIFEKYVQKDVKIIEFTKEELVLQLLSGKIDIDFLLDYIVLINYVYNKLIDEVRRLGGDL